MPSKSRLSEVADSDTEEAQKTKVTFERKIILNKEPVDASFQR